MSRACRPAEVGERAYKMIQCMWTSKIIQTWSRFMAIQRLHMLNLHVHPVVNQSHIHTRKSIFMADRSPIFHIRPLLTLEKRRHVYSTFFIHLAIYRSYIMPSSHLWRVDTPLPVYSYNLYMSVGILQYMQCVSIDHGLCHKAHAHACISSSLLSLQ